MYEIWLVINILWEMALNARTLLVAAAAIWVVLMFLALRGLQSRWRAALPTALSIGAAVALAVFLALPSLTRSGLGELAYWVDWANLGAVALGFGGAAAAFAWPLLAMRGGGRRVPQTSAS